MKTSKSLLAIVASASCLLATSSALAGNPPSATAPTTDTVAGAETKGEGTGVSPDATVKPNPPATTSIPTAAADDEARQRLDEAEARLRATRSMLSDAQVRLNKIEVRVSTLETDNTSLQLRLKHVEKVQDDLAMATAFNTASLGVGSYFSATDGAAFAVHGTLGPLFGCYLAKHGGCVGFDLLRHRVGPVNIRFLGLGVMFYQDGGEMHLHQYARTWDLMVKPIDLDVRVWSDKGHNVSVNVGGSVSWLLPSPKAAYDAADKQVADTSTPSTGGVSDQQSAENAANQAADNIKGTGERAMDAAGNIYKDALKTPIFGTFVSLRF